MPRGRGIRVELWNEAVAIESAWNADRVCIVRVGLRQDGRGCDRKLTANNLAISSMDTGALLKDPTQARPLTDNKVDAPSMYPFIDN